VATGWGEKTRKRKIFVISDDMVQKKGCRTLTDCRSGKVSGGVFLRKPGEPEGEVKGVRKNGKSKYHRKNKSGLGLQDPNNRKGLSGKGAPWFIITEENNTTISKPLKIEKKNGTQQQKRRMGGKK